MPPNPKPEPLKRQKARKVRENATRAKAFREAVWERDRGVCQHCGLAVHRPGTEPYAGYYRTGHVHHKIPRSLAPRLRFDPANGILVCHADHLSIHSGKLTLP